MMIEQLKIFFTALQFYTRLPIPKWVDYSQNYLDRSTRYFPLIGLIVGGAGALVFILTYPVLPKPVSLLLSMTATILLTGAFHEDGFADTCDGLGAGWTKEQILDIMKDSRIGTYGALGIFLMLVLKFQMLLSLNGNFIPTALIVGHSVSRAAVLIFRKTHSYVRDNDAAKAKPTPQDVSPQDFWIGIVVGGLPLAFLPPHLIFSVVVCVLITEFLFSYWVARRIGGYTGDCLGATQQLCELSCYLGILLAWKFI
jgi:adenosylcobinamide-GDP ribazoletransferase